MTKLPAGVVFGAAYRDLVANCKSEKFALPAVNVVGTNSLNAVLEAAGKAQSDVIIQLSNGGARYFAGNGFPNPETAMVLGAVSAAKHTALLAEHYGICVVLHTDHANRKLLGWVDGLIAQSEAHVAACGQPLFSSHMLDLSEEPVGQNLATCRDYLTRMAKSDMSLEIELGVTGGEEDGVGSEHDDPDNPHLYTQPTDVLAAYDMLSGIGHFSVAASFGNVHGVYKPGNVRLRPEILQNSQALVQTTHSTAENPLDLVFHGGSGSDHADIEEAIRYGVFKMNIDTDTQFAFAHGVGAYVEKHPVAFQAQLDPSTGKPTKKLYDPRAWLREGEKGVVDRLQQAFEDLGSAGRSVAA